MRNFHGGAGSVAVAALLVGCSPQPPAPPTMAPLVAAPATTPPPATAAMSGSGLDGVYRGPEGGTGGNARCTRKLGSPIRVSGGVATMSTSVTGTLEGPVRPDGSLNIQSGQAVLAGMFADGKFNGSYTYSSCTYTLNYAKR